MKNGIFGFGRFTVINFFAFACAEVGVLAMPSAPIRGPPEEDEPREGIDGRDEDERLEDCKRRSYGPDILKDEVGSRSLADNQGLSNTSVSVVYLASLQIIDGEIESWASMMNSNIDAGFTFPWTGHSCVPADS